MADEKDKAAAIRADRLADLFIFIRDVLEYHNITDLHLGWYQELLRHPFVLLLSPRGHFKTSAVTIGYALWRLTQNRNLRILLLNEVLANAKDFLSAIKGHIASERFRELYGPWDSLGNLWTAEKILVPRSKVLKEPSIAAAGVLGTIVSQHADLIIVDDPHSEKNSQTPHQRKKIISWFQQTVLPIMEPDGQLVICMTRWHDEDLAGHIMRTPGFGNWRVIEQRAETTGEDGKRRILFPERFSEKVLDRLRDNMGSAAYRTQMLNDVSGLEGAEFKLAWIESGRYDRPPEKLNVYAGIDLAIGQRDVNSSFAYSVIGLDAAGTAYVLDGFRGRLHFDQQLKTVKRLNNLHHPQLIGVETNGFQAAFMEALRIDPETRLLPLRDVVTQGDKHARLRGLAPVLEIGALRLPKPETGTWVGQMEEEFLGFPHRGEDMLDALWIALKVVNKQRVEPRISFAEDIW